jgi:hypothetical protein
LAAFFLLLMPDDEAARQYGEICCNRPRLIAPIFWENAGAHHHKKNPRPEYARLGLFAGYYFNVTLLS